MPQTSGILDIAILAVVVLFLVIGASKGFFRTLADLVMVFLASAGARMLADRMAVRLAEHLTPLLREKVAQRLGETLGDLADLAEELVASASAEMVESISYGILFLIAFIIALVILKIIVGATDLVLRLPVLRQCNQLGGAVLGLALGCFVAWLAVRICLTFGWWVTPEMVEGSRLLALLDLLPYRVNL